MGTTLQLFGNPKIISFNADFVVKVWVSDAEYLFVIGRLKALGIEWKAKPQKQGSTKGFNVWYQCNLKNATGIYFDLKRIGLDY